MTLEDSVIQENRDYWSKRARTYSEAVREDELDGAGYMPWLKTIEGRIKAHFGNRLPEELQVLDIGTGPGFFSIILAKAGYRVTAIDLTPSMLREAEKNAGELADRIDFREMNAESLDFPSDSFDLIVTRNLTWDLPQPEVAYREWHRVLRPNGLLLNFDANWYRYLFDDTAREAYLQDRRNAADDDIYQENPDVDYSVMEEIAAAVPLSRMLRPEWDVDILGGMGFSVTADCDIWQDLWNKQEKICYASTPMFLITAVKSREK